MSAAKTIEAQRKTAVIHRGSAACKAKFQELLEEYSVPKCLFQVAEIEEAEIEEFGFNRAIGFFWIRQKTKTERKINKVGTVYFDVEVSGFIERCRMWKITGVKGKEMLVSLPLCEMLVGYPTADKVKCFSTAGVYRVRPIAYYQNTK